MGRLGLAVMLLASTSVHAETKVAPPAVPAFDMLVPSQGAVGVQLLRATGRRAYENKLVVVRGYVTFVYDCVEAHLEPYKTRAQIEQWVAANPTKCERPSLRLGDTKTTPFEYSLRVADAVGTWKVGEYVEIEGTFAAGQVAFAKGAAGTPHTIGRVALPAPRSVAAMAAPKPMRRSPPPGEKMRAIGAAMQTARKHAEWLSWQDAQNEYRRIVATWDGHDTAWFELGYVYEAPGMFDQAAEAYGKAFAFVPANSAYASAYGRALWLREYQAARRAKAKQLGMHEEYVELSAADAKLNLDKAQQILQYAVSLDPTDWKAQMSLGDIHAAHEDHALAADAWTKAIAQAPKDHGPYARLAQLYREWGYEDQAIAVAQAWMSVRAPDDSSDRMYMIAAGAYEAKGDRKKAIEMLSVVLAHPARGASDAAFERARLYIATKQWDKAREDLALFPTHNKSRMREVNVLLSKIPAARPTKKKR